MNKIKIIGELEQEVLRLHKIGLTPNSIGMKTGVSKDTIKLYLQKNGIQANNRSTSKEESYQAFIEEVKANGGDDWSKIRKKYKISFEKAKTLLTNAGIETANRAQAAQKKKLSPEDALKREPEGTSFVRMDRNKYVFLCPDGHEYSKDVTKLGKGCPVGKSGRVRPIDEIEQDLLNQGFVLEKESYISTKKPITSFCIKCGKKRSVKMTLYRKWGCTYCTMSGTSNAEMELSDWIRTLGFFVEPKKLPKDTKYKSKTIDVFIASKNVGIDYAGLYWHNECSPTPRERDYHKDKMMLAKTVGIRLITLFEDEWKERNIQTKGRLESILGIYQEKYHARKCIVKEISFEKARIFCNTNHLQDGLKDLTFSCGIFFNDELLGVMAFGPHHRRVHKKSIVLKRLCFKIGVSVIGGASKLFSYSKDFLAKMGYTEVVSWSDNRWSEGDVYVKLGFTLEQELMPDYSYVKGSKRFSKQSLKKTPEERLSGLTEKQLRKEQGYSRIWDCGKKRWVYTIE